MPGRLEWLQEGPEKSEGIWWKDGEWHEKGMGNQKHGWRGGTGSQTVTLCVFLQSHRLLTGLLKVLYKVLFKDFVKKREGL